MTFCCILWKKKWYHNCLSNWYTPGWLPLWANDMASICCFISNIILSFFINMSFPVIVISSRIGLNFFNLSGEFFSIQFCPFRIIFISSVSTGSSLVAFPIDAIPTLLTIGVACNVYCRLCRSSVSFCSVSRISSKDFPCWDR